MRVFEKYLKTTHGLPYMDWEHVTPLPEPLHYDQLPDVDQVRSFFHVLPKSVD